MKKVCGIDGCKGGWILCTIDQLNPNFSFAASLDEIDGSQFDTILIDIPLYFADTDYRSSEIEARKRLKRRGSSIFFTPVREAVYEETYEKGLEINRHLTGKGFSKQAFYLFPKIKEAARFKEMNRDRVFESHPELCFSGWNKNPLNYSKKSKEGRNERLDLIKKLDAKGFQALEAFPLKAFQEDAIDAFILALTAKEKRRFTFLGNIKKESIVYFEA